MVKEGYKFAVAPLGLGVLALALRWNWTGGILVFLAAFILYFFRDPERIVPADPAVVVSPADGRVMEIVDQAMGSQPGRRVSIFLAIWDVHVNRAPLAGRIRKLEYRPGRFLARSEERRAGEECTCRARQEL